MNPARRSALPILIAASLGLALAPAPARAADPGPTLKAILEVDRDIYYAGDPVPIRLSVWNDSNAPVQAPGGDIPKGFELFDAEGKSVPSAPSAAGSGEAPAAGDTPPSRALPPGGFYGFARDLTTIFPRLKDAGTYRLQWRTGELASNAMIVRVVPRYDPDKDYTARLETDLGVMTIEFLRKDAPIAVKTFIELAQTGYFDGVIFHYVEPDRIVASGDPSGTGHGGPGFQIPHERTQVKMLAGTVIMPATGRPPSNGSIFAILLAPRPDFEGSATGFAQVVEGIDIARKISQVPAAPGDAGRPHRPLRDLHINRVTIKPKAS